MANALRIFDPSKTVSAYTGKNSEPRTKPVKIEAEALKSQRQKDVESMNENRAKPLPDWTRVRLDRTVEAEMLDQHAFKVQGTVKLGGKSVFHTVGHLGNAAFVYKIYGSYAGRVFRVLRKDLTVI